MQLIRGILIIFLILGSCLSYSHALAAQTCGDKGTCICTLDMQDNGININFNPILNSQLEAVFHLSITCALHHKGSEEIDYKVHFAPGHSDNIKYRHMHGSGEDILKYNIHQDSQHNLILGDGLGGMIELTHKYTLKQHTYNGHQEHSGEHSHQSPQTDCYTIHLEIPPQEQVHIGEYIDSLIVTLTY